MQYYKYGVKVDTRKEDLASSTNAILQPQSVAPLEVRDPEHGTAAMLGENARWRDDVASGAASHVSARYQPEWGVRAAMHTALKRDIGRAYAVVTSQVVGLPDDIWDLALGAMDGEPRRQSPQRPPIYPMNATPRHNLASRHGTIYQTSRKLMKHLEEHISDAAEYMPGELDLLHQGASAHSSVKYDEYQRVPSRVDHGYRDVRLSPARVSEQRPVTSHARDVQLNGARAAERPQSAPAKPAPGGYVSPRASVTGPTMTTRRKTRPAFGPGHGPPLYPDFRQTVLTLHGSRTGGIDGSRDGPVGPTTSLPLDGSLRGSAAAVPKSAPRIPSAQRRVASSVPSVATATKVAKEVIAGSVGAGARRPATALPERDRRPPTPTMGRPSTAPSNPAQNAGRGAATPGRGARSQVGLSPQRQSAQRMSVGVDSSYASVSTISLMRDDNVNLASASGWKHSNIEEEAGAQMGGQSDVAPPPPRAAVLKAAPRLAPYYRVGAYYQYPRASPAPPTSDQQDQLAAAVVAKLMNRLAAQQAGGEKRREQAINPHRNPHSAPGQYYDAQYYDVHFEQRPGTSPRSRRLSPAYNSAEEPAHLEGLQQPGSESVQASMEARIPMPAHEQSGHPQMAAVKNIPAHPPAVGGPSVVNEQPEGQDVVLHVERRADNAYMHAARDVYEYAKDVARRNDREIEGEALTRHPARSRRVESGDFLLQLLYLKFNK